MVCSTSPKRVSSTSSSNVSSTIYYHETISSVIDILLWDGQPVLGSKCHFDNDVTQPPLSLPCRTRSRIGHVSSSAPLPGPAGTHRIASAPSPDAVRRKWEERARAEAATPHNDPKRHTLPASRLSPNSTPISVESLDSPSPSLHRIHLPPRPCAHVAQKPSTVPLVVMPPLVTH